MVMDQKDLTWDGEHIIQCTYLKKKKAVWSCDYPTRKSMRIWRTDQSVFHD